MKRSSLFVAAALAITLVRPAIAKSPEKRTVLEGAGASWQCRPSPSDAVSDSVFVEPDVCGVLPYFLDFVAAMDRQALPNCQARLHGCTPAYEHRLQAGYDDAFRAVRRHDSPGLWRLFDVLATRERDTNDDMAVWAVARLAIALSPSRFEELAANVGSTRPENVRMFDETREFDAAKREAAGRRTEGTTTRRAAP